MAENDLVGDVKGANNELSKMGKLIEKLTTDFKKFTQASSGAFSDLKTSGFGSRNLGVGSPNFLNSSLGSVPQIVNQSMRYNAGFSALQGGITALTGVVSGGFAAMPNVQMTTARSGAYYNAGLMTNLGAGGRNILANATFGAMQGGISSLGSDAVTTANLISMGITPTVNKQGMATGQFGNLLTSTANAAKYLNIDNATAARSLGGLTQGGMSSNLMRNFGIYTTDPITGRRLSPTEIFKSISNRILGGQKLSTKELQTSMQGGALSVDLSQIGDQATQDMVYQYMLSNASDAKTKKGMDLGSKSSMDAFGKAYGTNPFGSQYSANTSQTATMQAASDAYIEGMKKAAVVIDRFNKAMQGFLRTPAGQAMAQLNAGTSLAMQDNVIGGGMTALGGLAGGLGQIGMGLAQNALLKRTLTKAGVLGGKGSGGGIISPGMAGKTTKLPKGFKFTKNGRVYNTAEGRLATTAETEAIASKAPGLLTKVGGVLARGSIGALGGELGGAVASMTGANSDQSFWAGLGTSFAAGELMGGEVTFGLTGLASAGLYALGNMGSAGQAFGDLFSGKGTGTGGWGGGGQSSIAGGRTTDTSGGIKLIHPVGRAQVTTKYGQVDKLHPNGHYAIDWAVAIGTPVQAAAAGTVKDAGGTATNTMGTSDHSYGLYVEIDHGGGYSTWYGHLSSIGVSKGAQVTQGQQFALSGNTGYSTGPHLHFELRKNGVKIDPSSALGGNYAAISGSYSEVTGMGGSASNSSDGSYSSDSGGAGLLGFSTGAATAAGLQVPPSYGGGGSVQTAGNSGASLGHGGTTTAVAGGSVGSGQGGSNPTRSSSGGNNVTINVSVASASESEARRFAKLVKQYLDDDFMTSKMGLN